MMDGGQKSGPLNTKEGKQWGWGLPGLVSQAVEEEREGMSQAQLPARPKLGFRA